MVLKLGGMYMHIHTQKNSHLSTGVSVSLLNMELCCSLVDNHNLGYRCFGRPTWSQA